MTRTFKSLALGVVAAAVLAGGSIAPAGATSGATATLTVNGTVTNNCAVDSQPAALNMSYDAISDTPTSGTSSFTFTCTNGASVTITPTSSNTSNTPNWDAVNGPNALNYNLFNDLACTTGQMSQGTAVNDTGTGSAQTFDICGVPSTGQQSLPAGTYTDTVTFTFNYGP